MQEVLAKLLSDTIYLMRFRSFIESFQFLGPCDRVRRQSPENEQFWHEMIAKATPVSQQEFLSHVDVSSVIDDDETPEDYFRGHPDVEFYRSVWGGRPAFFFESRGFEFIFVQHS